MCYSYKVIWNEDKSKHLKVPHSQFKELTQSGQVQRSDEGLVFFPKNQVPVVLNSRYGQRMVTSMRWDLLPRWFQGDNTQQVDLLTGAEQTLEKVLQDKKFHSYNARIESIQEKASYRLPWEEGKRCLLPLDSFWERPNMVGAPSEIKGKSFEMEVQGGCALAGIWDVWQGYSLSESGELIQVQYPSVSVITLSGSDHPVMQKVYHDRAPAIIEPRDFDKWLSNNTGTQESLELVKSYREFTIKEGTT